MHQSVVYISKPTFPTAQAARVISSIVAPATARNAALGVTGALIATEHHFAQVLEGEGAALDALLASIARDPRHRDVTIVRRQQAVAPRFAGWSLAYQGRSAYFDSFISALARETERRLVDIERLVDLMSRLAAPQPRHVSRDLPAS